jgi:hypothetical protein
VSSAETTVKAYIMNKKEGIEKQLKAGGLDLWKIEVEGLISGIQRDYEGIYSRRKQVNGFGIIHGEGKFIELIGEALMTYELQFYTSTISLCGTMAERICYDFIDFSTIVVNGKELTPKEKESLYDMPFRQLLEFLHNLGMIDKDSKSVLHEMYNIRNKYVHLKGTNNADNDALEILNKFCGVAEKLFSMFNFYDVKNGKFVKKGSA